MHIRFVSFAGLALLGVSPAAAQTFTGPRVEAVIGLDQLHFDLEDIGGEGLTKRADLGYGFAAGYDAELAPNLIGGVEAAVTLSDADYAIGSAADGASMRSRRDLSIAGRLGTRITDTALVYGKVGYTNFQTGTTTTVAGIDSYSRRNLDGVLLGVGAEVAITPKAYLKSEYRYSNYQDGVSKNDIMTGVGLRF